MSKACVETELVECSPGAHSELYRQYHCCQARPELLVLMLAPTHFSHLAPGSLFLNYIAAVFPVT